VEVILGAGWEKKGLKEMAKICAAQIGEQNGFSVGFF
jgi:hypothetical protein